MSTIFGQSDPKKMPEYLFSRHLRLDYSRVLQADTSRQNFTVCPRYWYVDAYFRCRRCREEFCFSASEQRSWYEDFGFFIDSIPRECVACRHDLRRIKSLRQQYDGEVSQALSSNELPPKVRVVILIDSWLEAGEEAPPQMQANRALLMRQIARLRRMADAEGS